MIVFRCEQGGLDWSMLRMGIPTASNFAKILTPGGKQSTQSSGYMRHLIAESFFGAPIDAPKSSWMERGMEMEGEAVSYYEFERSIAVEQVGFVTLDDYSVGCSPDRLIGDDGLLEIKCPSPSVHAGYVLYQDLDSAYRSQIQGQLWVTGRQWCDIVSYHPAMPPCIIRVARDEEYISALSAAVTAFVRELAAEKSRLAALGHEFRDARRREVIDRLLQTQKPKKVRARRRNVPQIAK